MARGFVRAEHRDVKQRTPLQVVLVRLHLRFSSLPVFRGSRLLVFRLRVFDLRAPPVPQRLGRRHREERQEHVRGRAEADGVGQVEKVGRVLLNVRGSRLLRASLRGSLAFALARRVRRRVGGQAHARGARGHGAGAEQLPHVLPLAFTDLERQVGLALVTRKAVVAVVAVIIQVARAWREVVRLPAETRARHCRAHAHGRPRFVPIEPLGVVRSRQKPQLLGVARVPGVLGIGGLLGVSRVVVRHGRRRGRGSVRQHRVSGARSGERRGASASRRAED